MNRELYISLKNITIKSSHCFNETKILKNHSVPPPCSTTVLKRVFNQIKYFVHYREMIRLDKSDEVYYCVEMNIICAAHVKVMHRCPRGPSNPKGDGAV